MISYGSHRDATQQDVTSGNDTRNPSTVENPSGVVSVGIFNFKVSRIVH